ncbi:sodium-dependent neutral amino acid transporter B(0)AT2-like [Hypanus sabinus]|uniref:sodium-dependent neutral amino acid transporter B(0)AT2-like n=1 Tax=Hypanus sabinus TaxID=79690 RepID=UPI0028C4A8BB|nr:sodium-dependent neutral amino acid transporter B(0)AT2-like [Hypanus sabinus]XP_059809666.1 sodium-dependent neutral amino acid transporter B(0)AT2-like [Hypanus sabinus]XP_059809667.1 sodium-dependent neutral amino acid transporter B(0)AT2-like [Hypanus sabinus]XP_059809668.1 sodium-dependent neutral amino acid transporter B(0)AT2-like [Hypanus sabinus]XP_059809669.1 sodium-dependent neutral amino acid transporter B(0)AT2-like [Hypanus sabinus]
MEKSKTDSQSVDATEFSTGLVLEQPHRPAWGNKLQYILAQVGFSVGLGNVWRFPYLCHQNGGGAFLFLYLLMLVVIGIPLFFLELAAGQSIRQGSIGVWKHINPKLAGIGFASCVVCGFVSLYYNVIIAWSLFYFGHSFQYPLPWESCPSLPNNTGVVTECSKSSPTTYFWYHETLEITSSINESGGLNPTMTGCLLGAWVIVCLAMIKGIKSSGKVMYFSSLFPYLVLFCFLVRGLLLEGSVDGIRYMFTPKIEILVDTQVWRQAATQVFFALGLGFGSVIAYSSYNSHTNNCHFDAYLVSFINFFTSIFATLVVFAVLGFRANVLTQKCVQRNTLLVTDLINSGLLNRSLIPESLNFSMASHEQYSKWFDSLRPELVRYGVEQCDLRHEMQKGAEGTGLAFIAFTEAITHFPASPFWSLLFFLMLLNLGLSTMFGNMQGILTPLLDNFPLLSRRKSLFTVFCCILGFITGLIFTQRSGNYFVTMFDDYSATLPLIIVVFFELMAVAWIYGADKFIDDIRKMIGDRPFFLYKYLWKFICPVVMLALLLASLIQLCVKHPTYRAWNETKAEEVLVEYPDWALAMMIILIIVASLPIPLLYLWQMLLDRQTSHSDYSECAYIEADAGDEASFPLNEDDDEALGPNGYLKVNTEEGGMERSELLLGEEGEEDVFEMDNMSQEKNPEVDLKL